MGFGTIIAFTCPILGIVFSEDNVIGEQLCVDGNNNINLEGIMCQETEHSVLGITFGWFTITTLIFGLLGCLIFILGLEESD